MFNESYIAYAMIAVGIFTVYMAVMHFFRSDIIRKRIKNAGLAAFVDANTEEVPPAFAQLCDKTLKILKVNTEGRKDLTMWMARAGINSPYAVSYYLFTKTILQPLLLLLGTLALLKSFSGGDGVLANVVLAFIFIIFGLWGSKLYIDNRKQKRQSVLVDSFPETLDLLLVCIESGLGLDAALNRVCKEMRNMHPVVVGELDRTRLELTMLNDRVQALQNLAERTEIVSFKTLVASLIQTEKFGTSLVDTLRVLSEEQRLTRLFTAEQKAARIPVLITIPLILCILPAFIMIIVGPPLIKVVNNGGIFGGHIATSPKH